MKRKCSMCGEYKDITQFRFLNKQNRHIAYCRDCERWYQRHYVRKNKKEKVDERVKEKINGN